MSSRLDKMTDWKHGRELRVVVVDDDTKARRALDYMLEQAREFRCCGSFSKATEALVGIPAISPELVLMDIRLPDLSGIECTRRLKEMMPELKVVILSAFLDAKSVEECWKAGADNCVTKPVVAQQCLATLRFTAFGSPARQPNAPSESAALTDPLLTPRQNEIMGCFARGLQYKEVAAELGLSESTVHNHQHEIYAKYHVSNKIEAVNKWQQRLRD